MAYVCYVVFASEGSLHPRLLQNRYVDVDVSECPQTWTKAITRLPVVVESVARSVFGRPGTPDLSMSAL